MIKKFAFLNNLNTSTGYINFFQNKKYILKNSLKNLNEDFYLKKILYI